MTDCQNCRALRERIERADRVMVELNPLIDEVIWCKQHGYAYVKELDTDDMLPLLRAFNLYTASELDARIAEARTDEPAPQTQPSLGVDEIVERSR